MRHNFPKATIKSVRRERERLLVELTFDREPTAPVVPAFLFGLTASGEAADRRALVILEWCCSSGPAWTFEAANGPLQIAPEEVFGYQGMWTPAALDAVTDLSATWTRTQYPGDGSHEHCLVTFVTISSYQGEPVGYFCTSHGWLSERAYEEHILGDLYKIRARLQGLVPYQT